MPLIKSHEPIHVTCLNILVYGVQGLGKTSLACTSKKSLLLDFDGGAHRSHFRKDTWLFDSWDPELNKKEKFWEHLEPFDTIIIDTVDSMLSKFLAYLEKCDRSLMKNKLRGFGALQTEFNSFFRRISELKKDLVMICHVKEEKRGEDIILRPEIMGSSYKLVMQKADFVGYLSMIGGKKVLDFNSSDYAIGKNSAYLKPLEIPTFVLGGENHFMADVIDVMKSEINKGTHEFQLSLQADEIALKLSQCMNIKEINDCLIEGKDFKGIMKRQIWNAAVSKAKDLNAEFDEELKLFTKKITIEPKAEKSGEPLKTKTVESEKKPLEEKIAAVSTDEWLDEYSKDMTEPSLEGNEDECPWKE